MGAMRTMVRDAALATQPTKSVTVARAHRLTAVPTGRVLGPYVTQPAP